MILSYTRGIGNSIKNQVKRNWDKEYSIYELYNSTIMIVGAGQIGSQVGKLSKAFGMNTLDVHRSGRNAEYMDKCTRQEEVADYLKDTDIVVNVLPFTNLV